MSSTNTAHVWSEERVGFTCYLCNTMFTVRYVVLYENIDQILPNQLHGPMHYNIGVTCVYNGHVFYTLF